MAEQKLFDLFGDLSNDWPYDEFGGIAGELIGSNDQRQWLDDLNESIRLRNVRTGSSSGGAALQADLSVVPPVHLSSGVPVVHWSMKEVVFKLVPTPSTALGDSTVAREPSKLFVSQTDLGIEVIVEGLAVEIELPVDMLDPLEEQTGSVGLNQERVDGAFEVGVLDTQKVVYRRDQPSSIFVHVRVHLDSDRHLVVTPAVPINLRDCRLFGLPARAVYDFKLVHSPSRASELATWLRHTPMNFMGDHERAGMFATRKLELYPEREPIKAITETISAHVQKGADDPSPPTVDFVFEDIVAPVGVGPTVPVGPGTLFPVPGHVTVGIRRPDPPPERPEESYLPSKAPVMLCWGGGSNFLGMLVESFFFQSLPLSVRDVGVHFNAAFYFDESGPDHQLTVDLVENLTLRLGYRRGFSSWPGLPEPKAPGEQDVDALLHWEIADVVIDIVGVRVGFSFGKWATREPEDDFPDWFEATGDLLIHTPPSGDGLLKLRAINEQPLLFALEELGWRQGRFNFPSVSMPDGVMVIFADMVGLVIREFILTAEDGAQYFGMSGGLIFEPLGKFDSYRFEVYRLRFPLGDGDVSPFKLDGFFFAIDVPPTSLEVGGYYRDETKGDTRVRELGLTGTFSTKVGGTRFELSIDVIAGEMSPAVGDAFSYFMAQVYMRAPFPFGFLEVRSIRLLGADDMQPKLDERAARESMGLLHWYHENNPLVVGGERRLAAWEPVRASYAFGVGLSASLPCVGDLIEFGIFYMQTGAEDSGEALVLLEVIAGQTPQPVAFFAVEFSDYGWAAAGGLDLKVAELVDGSVADWLDFQVTGFGFFSSATNETAIGRVHDQNSWLRVAYEKSLFGFETAFMFALVYEDAPETTGVESTFGLLLHLEGGFDCDVLEAKYYLTLGLVIGCFSTKSSDGGFSAFFEGAFRLRVLSIIRLGLSTRVEFRTIGSPPTYREASVSLRVETPWFLPDVSWKWEHVSGGVQVAKLATATDPLRMAAALTSVDAQTYPTFEVRIDGSDPTQLAASTFSIEDFRGGVAAEETRLRQFETALADGEVKPVPIDATIKVGFTVPVRDGLALEPAGFDEELGVQTSGDLELGYELVGLRVRRRPRYGDNRSWDVLEGTKKATFSYDQQGNPVLSEREPEILSKFWDRDYVRDGKPGHQSLLINARTPFAFRVEDPTHDEQTVAANPDWPCCPSDRRTHFDFPIRKLDFRGEAPGTQLDVPRTFSGSNSTFTALTPAIARPSRLASVSGGAPVCASIQLSVLEPAFRAELEEDAWIMSLRYSGTRAHKHAVLVVGCFDKEDTLVSTESFYLVPGQWKQLVVGGQNPFRRVDGWLLYGGIDADSKDAVAASRHDNHLEEAGTIEVLEAAYIPFEPLVRTAVEARTCATEQSVFRRRYEGKGKLAFLPNHEYEIEVTTRVSGQHPTVDQESVDLKEYVYFQTKGLTGLNAVEQVGDELRPYVEAQYTGGTGYLYREEPLVVCFSEDFHVAVPLDARTGLAVAEDGELLELELTVSPEIDSGEDFATAVSEDWLDQHSQAPTASNPGLVSLASGTQIFANRGLSTDPYLARLARLTQRETSTCRLDDPRNVIQPLLIARPPTDAPADGGWPSRARVVGAVRAKSDVFIDRAEFAAADLTALTFAADGHGSDSSAWKVRDAELLLSNPQRRRFAVFGTSDWVHFDALARLRPDGARAGLGLAIRAASGAVSAGLFVSIEGRGDVAELAFYERSRGEQFSRRDSAEIPASADGAYALRVRAFDDQIVASVGETRISVPRGDHRTGRVCLFAEGQAAFTRLQVHSLEMYRLSAKTSRYRSFSEHIDSFSGQGDEIRLRDFASNPAVDVGQVWTNTKQLVRDVMTPEASAGDRQRVFEQWASKLSLPWRNSVKRVELSNVSVGQQYQLVLIESPEPIDFATDVSVLLEQRVAAETAGDSGMSDWVVDLELLQELKRLLKWTQIEAVLEDLLGEGEGEPGLLGPDSADLETWMSPARLAPVLTGAFDGVAPPARAPTLSVHSTRRSLDSIQWMVEDQLVRQRDLVFFEVTDRECGKQLKIMRGTTGRGAGITKVAADSLLELAVAPDGRFARAPAGATIIVDPLGSEVIDYIPPNYRWEEVPTTTLQDAAATRAILVPLDAANHHQGLERGRYRATFSIDRERYKSRSSSATDSRYQQDVTVEWAI